ncbi:VP7 [Colorado tick fever virus]|uniref:Uncharacterized protein VP7 n=1 Tax=Colorado tick fever virus (strain USA/Florio N-7180) TaxID=648168 RepID=VP7_CTFVL|nr:VP7 [Colorado tick fever virus]Q9ENK9.1 RecName: Full=Uncharacterized protein VP7 [Colorado tick fever virus Florio N-7180]AAG00072.1 VP7 [Colorado tick fever virus]
MAARLPIDAFGMSVIQQNGLKVYTILPTSNLSNLSDQISQNKLYAVSERHVRELDQRDKGKVKKIKFIVTSKSVDYENWFGPDTDTEIIQYLEEGGLYHALYNACKEQKSTPSFVASPSNPAPVSLKQKEILSNWKLGTIVEFCQAVGLNRTPEEPWRQLARSYGLIFISEVGALASTHVASLDADLAKFEQREQRWMKMVDYKESFAHLGTDFNRYAFCPLIPPPCPEDSEEAILIHGSWVRSEEHDGGLFVLFKRVTIMDRHQVMGARAPSEDEEESSDPTEGSMDEVTHQTETLSLDSIPPPDFSRAPVIVTGMTSAKASTSYSRDEPPEDEGNRASARPKSSPCDTCTDDSSLLQSLLSTDWVTSVSTPLHGPTLPIDAAKDLSVASESEDEVSMSQSDAPPETAMDVSANHKPNTDSAHCAPSPLPQRARKIRPTEARRRAEREKRKLKPYYRSMEECFVPACDIESYRTSVIVQPLPQNVLPFPGTQLTRETVLRKALVRECERVAPSQAPDPEELLDSDTVKICEGRAKVMYESIPSHLRGVEIESVAPESNEVSVIYPRPQISMPDNFSLGNEEERIRTYVRKRTIMERESGGYAMLRPGYGAEALEHARYVSAAGVPIPELRGQVLRSRASREMMSQTDLRLLELMMPVVNVPPEGVDKDLLAVYKATVMDILTG